MVYKSIFSLIMIVFLSCTQIDRDNILDPKNPSSRTESVVLLESFINTSDNEKSHIVRYAMDANDALLELYSERLIILEYHRDRNSSEFDDSLTIDNNEVLHNTYQIVNSSVISGGVPDTYINGALRREQGAFSATELVNRVKVHIEEQLTLIGEYSIEVDFNLSAGNLTGNYRIARLANKSSDIMKLRIVATSNSGEKGKRSVRAVHVISLRAIESGEYIEGTFSLANVNEDVDKLVLILKNNTDTKVLHSLEKEIL